MDMLTPESSQVVQPEPAYRLSQHIAALAFDPDDPVPIAGIAQLVQFSQDAPQQLGEQVVRKLGFARKEHEQRGEYGAVARLLELEVEIPLLRSNPVLSAVLFKELGRVRSEFLLDLEGAKRAYAQALSHTPEDLEAQDALSRLEQLEPLDEHTERFAQEVQTATDPGLKAQLLMRAAQFAWENQREDQKNSGQRDGDRDDGPQGQTDEVDHLFAELLALDPTNLRAALSYEHTLRERERWPQLAEHLLRTADVVRSKQERANLQLRAARVLSRRLGDEARAIACYAQVLQVSPAQSEAMAFLIERFTHARDWDKLAALHERALSVPQKLDTEQALLIALGQLHNRERGRPSEAEPYFARLRKLDPGHPSALDFYRRYLLEQGEPERWLRVLLDAQRSLSDPQQRAVLAVEAAELSHTLYGAGERAIEAWRNVQRLDPQHAEAARELRELYAKTEKWNALVSVLKAQIDAMPDGPREPKIALLRELAAVYRDRLHLDGMLIQAYTAILRLDPRDRETLDALAEKYRELGRWNDLINVLMWDAEATPEAQRRVRIYLRVAELWLSQFSNHNQAAGPLEKVLEIEPYNQQASAWLRDIYERKRAWRPLFEVMRKQREAAVHAGADARVIITLTLSLAGLAAERLHRYPEALALYREVLDVPGQGDIALDAIERLSEREKDWTTLAEVIERRSARAKNREEQVRLSLKLGALYADRLNDSLSACRVWRDVLAIEPRQGRALRSLRDAYVARGDWDALEALYGSAGDWEGVVEVLSSEAERASRREHKVQLSFRAAHIYETELHEPLRAQRAYERVLSVDPDNAQAARALVPIYEHDEKWARLSTMLAIVLRSLPAPDPEHPEDATERVTLLSRLCELSRERVRDVDAAFEYALRLYELTPTDEGVEEMLLRCAQTTGGFARVVAAYRARAEQAAPTEALSLWRRVAQIAHSKLRDHVLATAYAERVLQAAPEDGAALTILDSVYRTQDQPAELRRLLLHRLQHQPEDARRVHWLRELAVLEEERLGDAQSAAEHYRELVVSDPKNPELWAKLDRLAQAAGRYAELAAVLSRRRELAVGNVAARVELGARLAQVVLELEQSRDPVRALTLLEEGLELDPGHGPSLATLEHLVRTEPQLSASAVVTLERAYERIGRFDKLAALLKERLQGAQDEAEIRRLRLRSAEIRGGKLGDDQGAYQAIEAVFIEEPDDRALWPKLMAAADRAKQHRSVAAALAQAIEHPRLSDEDRVELAARAAQLYDEVLHEPRTAEVFHKRVLAHDPKEETAFDALKELYTTDERWEDLQQLYKARIEDTADADSRLELLLQLCFLFEEILEQPDRAIDTYRAVLELSPEHMPSRRALERLYERAERHAELVALLKSNLEHAAGYDQVDTYFKLGELYETKLHEPGLAVDGYEAALLRQPHHLRAQAALSRLLADPGQRQRCAEILEPLYESQGAYTDLVRVLEVRLADPSPEARLADPSTEVRLTAAAGEEARADLWLRIGALYETRLRDADNAFAAYARAVQTYPRDPRGREALARLGVTREPLRKRRAEVLDAVQETLRTSDASASGVSDVSIDVLSELGELLLEQLSDRVGAERCYKRLREIAGSRDDVALSAARALERIHIQAGDHAALAVDLSEQVEREFDPEMQEQLLFRLAELYEHKLSNPQAAIATQRKRIELDADRLDALRALERLYEVEQRFADLVSVLEQRQRLTEDIAERSALGRRVAHLLEDKLSDVPRAIEQWRANIAAFGPDRAALHALGQLYESTGQHAELLDTLEAEVAFATDAESRAELHLRMAELLRVQLSEPERAIPAYQAALAEVPEHAGALSALEALALEPASSVRRDAAQVLLPAYESLARYDKLLTMLELVAETGDSAERMAALSRAAVVVEKSHQNTPQAQRYLARALQAAASHENLPALLDRFEELSHMTGNYREYVLGLQQIVADIPDPQRRLAVYREIASVAQSRLKDAALARSAYRSALREQPQDVTLLDALIALDAAAGEHTALLDVLARKVELVPDAGTRARLLEQKAEVYERDLSDPDRAIAELKRALQEWPLPTAFESIERLYQHTQRHTDLAGLYSQQIAQGVGREVELRYRLACVYRRHLNEDHAALEQLRVVMDLEPSHSESIALLEEIMRESADCRVLAAEVLEPGYLARRQWSRLTTALSTRVDAESDPDVRRRLLMRLSNIYEEQLEDFNATLEVYARLFAEDHRDEELWERLTRLAKVSNQWQRLASILGRPLEAIEQAEDEASARLARYVGALYDERVGAPDKAAEFYVKALRFGAGARDQAAFRALEALYRRTQNHAALLELYKTQAQYVDVEQRVELLHSSALVLVEHQQDLPAAIASYREILALDPEDPSAPEKLEALLSSVQDWQGLAEQLRWRSARPGHSQRALKHRLAELYWRELSERSQAIELWREILAEDPAHAGALEALEAHVQHAQGEPYRLRIADILEPAYRKQDQWRKQIALHEARAMSVSDRYERARLFAEIGELQERRASDDARAFHAYARGFANDPQDAALRGHVDRLAQRTRATKAWVDAYEAAVKASDSDETKLSLLKELARAHDEQLGDPRAAIQAYERVFVIDPENKDTLDSLELLHTMVADWSGLVDVLTRKAELVPRGQARADVLRHIAVVREEHSSDKNTAIEAYRRALAEFPEDELALEALDRLHGGSGQAAQLFDVLQRRIELASDPALRAELGLRLGFLADVRLHRTAEAVDIYRAVLDDDPQNAIAVGHLCSLHERLGQWGGLLDNLRVQLRGTENPTARARLYCRVGRVLSAHLLDGPGAIDAYREALAADPSAEEAKLALLELACDAMHAVQAADVLEPALRSDQRWPELVTLIERKLAGVLDPRERREELFGLAEIHEHELKNERAAFDTLLRALRQAACDPQLLAHLERLAARRSAWEELYDRLRERAGQEPPREACELLRAAGRIAASQLRDPRRAIEAYQAAADQDADQDDDAVETLAALDHLYADTERWDELADILERRVAVSDEPSERADLLVRLGELRERVFDDARAAFVAFSEVLDSDPNAVRALEGLQRLSQRPELAQDALSMLDHCYRKTGALERAVELYAARVELAPTAAHRAQLLRDAAQMWENELARPERALSSICDAYICDPNDIQLLDELERLAERVQAWSELSGLPEKLARDPALSGSARSELLRRAAAWYREHLVDARAEESMLRALLAENEADLDAHARLLELVRSAGRASGEAQQAEPADPHALFMQLLAFSAVDEDDARKLAHLREAASLALSLGDADHARALYEDVLSIAPEDSAALSALAELHATQGDHARAISYLSRLLDLEVEPERRSALYHAIALAYAESLHDSERAAQTYQQLLDEFPEDPAGQRALEGLFSDAQRFDELEALWTRELDRTSNPERRAQLRLRLSELYERQLVDAPRALSALRAVLQESPEHPEALAPFERLLLAVGPVQERMEWLQQRVERAVSSGAVKRAVDGLWQLLDVTEEQGADPAQVEAARESLLRRIEALAPHDERLLRNQVALYRATGRLALAAQAMERLLEVVSRNEVVAFAHQLADLAERELFDLQRSRRALRRALEVEPTHAATRARLRNVLRAENAHAELVQLLEQELVLAAEPAEQAQLLREIALLRAEHLGDASGALVALEHAVRLVPNDRPCLLSLCDLYIGGGRSADAIQVLEKLIASYGGRRAKEVAQLEHRLGQAYERLDKPDEAFKHYDNAFKIDLTSVVVLRDLARLSLSRGDLERAQKTYRALLLQKLGDEHGITKSDVYYRLGEISAEQGDKVKAKAMLERAIAEGGQHAQAEALLEQL